MQMQHTRPHGPYPALLAGMHVVTIPLRSVKSSSRHLPAGQARKRVSKAVQRLGAADLQAPKQPGPSTIQAAGMIERSADAQQKYSDAPERLSSSALLRRLTAVSTANEALDIFLQDGAAMQCSDALQGFTEEDCRWVISACMARGNAQLALSIYGTMCRVGPSSSSTCANRQQEQSAWPPATLETVSAVVTALIPALVPRWVMCLARALRLRDAYSAIAEVRRRRVPQGEEVPFGQVINSPMAAGAPLTVVHPHEGCRVAACASSRYELEVFSGEVVRVDSEALVQEQSLLLAAARTANPWRQQPLASVHQMVVCDPDGQARTFRFGTESADVPAQVGERVSIVCSPTERSVQSLQRGRFRPFGSGPPFTKPGQPMSATNHNTSREHALQPPPSSAAGIPAWVLPAAVLFSASDAASGPEKAGHAGLLNPAMPLLILGAAASAATAGVLGSTVVVPRMRQLPEQSLQLETVRQKLLAQHNALVRCMDQLEAEAAEDVRLLARLWQLQNKMESVGSGASYGARIERAGSAISGLELRLNKHLELLDGYSRVANMIEIEVEIDAELPAAEVQGIADQIDRLEEVAEMQADWNLQADAQDEVERILRAN